MAVNACRPYCVIPIAIDGLVENLPLVLYGSVEHVVDGEKRSRSCRAFLGKFLRAQDARVLRPELQRLRNDKLSLVVLHRPRIVVVPRRTDKITALARVDDVSHDFEDALLDPLTACARKTGVYRNNVVTKYAVVVRAGRNLVDSVCVDAVLLRHRPLERVKYGTFGRTHREWLLMVGEREKAL